MFGFSRVPDLQWSYGESKASQPGVVAYYAGLRQCSNPSCHAVIATFSDNEGRRPVHPPEVLVFDGTSLPPGFMGSIEEAVLCHVAGLHTASALMVRHMLEQLCNDISIDDQDLQGTIAALDTFTVITGGSRGDSGKPRIVINDDAEIEVRDRNTVSEAESHLALYLAKQLLRAVYQYASLKTQLLSLKTAPGMG